MSGINDKEFSNIDGDIVNYEIEYSQGRIKPNSKEGFMIGVDGDTSGADGDYYGADGEDFYDADGDYENGDELGDDYVAEDSDYAGADGDTDEFYNAKGKRRKKKKGGGFFSRLLDNQREKNRLKFQAKNTLAKAQVESAKAMGKGTAGDIALAKSLEAKPDSEPVQEGLSKNAKIGIGVGVALVVGVIAFVVIKKMGKGKGK